MSEGRGRTKVARWVRSLAMGATALGAISATPASALTPFGGHIIGIYVSNSTNYAYRVYFGGLSDCNGSWAYKNANEDNYQSYVAVLQSAFIAGQAVTIYYEKDTGGYCHIVECLASG